MDVGAVLAFERVNDEDGSGVEVKIDDGSGSPVTAEHYASSGDDAPPLPTDFAALKDSTGNGSIQAIGYVDPKNTGKAAGGEKRIYARDSDGNAVAEVWLHGDGLIEITSLMAGGRYKIGLIEIDEHGNLTTPGEITAMKGPAQVTLSKHIHSTANGPSGPPTPGQ